MTLLEDATRAFRTGENERARQLSEQSLAAAVSAGDTRDRVESLCMLSRTEIRDGAFERAASFADDARAIAQASGQLELERAPLHCQAGIARMSGPIDRARMLVAESIELCRALDEPEHLASELHNLGWLELRDDGADPTRARQLFTEAIAEAQTFDYGVLLPGLVADLGLIAELDGDPATAARRLGTVQAAYEALGRVADPDDAEVVERLRARAEATLGHDRCAALEQDGRADDPRALLARGAPRKPRRSH